MQAYERMQLFNRAERPKDVYKQMQKWQVKNTPDDGVFCPSSEIWQYNKALALFILKQGIPSFEVKYDDFDDELRRMLRLFWGCHLFGAWRNTLSIYQIDQDIFSQIVQSPIPNDTPSNIFSRLPEWCVYLEFPQDYKVAAVKKDTSHTIEGFWALLDYQVIENKKKQLMLNLVPNISGKMGTVFDQLHPLQMPISDDMTVKESCKYYYQTAMQLDPLQQAESFDTDYKMTTTFLSLLLWLCAEKPDISNLKGEPVTMAAIRLPKHRRNKKGSFIPPTEPTIYQIGKRLGGEVREFKVRISAKDSRISSRKRPHIRKGHWHGVWAGTGQNKHFKIYWQPAIFVNAN